MLRRSYAQDSFAEIDAAIVTQFARLLRLQAIMLAEDGDVESAQALLRKADSQVRGLLTRH